MAGSLSIVQYRFMPWSGTYQVGLFNAGKAQECIRNRYSYPSTIHGERLDYRYSYQKRTYASALVPSAWKAVGQTEYGLGFLSFSLSLPDPTSLQGPLLDITKSVSGRRRR